MIETTAPEAPAANLAERAATVLQPGQLLVTTLADQQDGKAVVTYCKVTTHGLIRSMKHMVPMRPDMGHTYPLTTWFWDKEANGFQSKSKTLITACGYDRLVQFAGLSYVPVSTVMDDQGVERGNPCFQREQGTGHILSVTTRQIAIGRNPTGSLVALDYTLTFDPRTYRAQDVLSRWTGRKTDAPKAWGRLHSTRNDPTVPTKVFEHQDVVPVLEGLVLIVDLTNKDVITCICEHGNLQRFAGQRVITMARRNIAKKFFGVSELDESLTVPVVSWPSLDITEDELWEIGSAVVKGEALKLAGEPVAEATVIKEDVGFEDAQVVNETETDEDSGPSDDQAPDADVGVSVPEGRAQHAAPSDADYRKRDEWSRLLGKIGKTRAQKVLTDEGIKITGNWDGATADRATNILLAEEVRMDAARKDGK